MFSPKLVTSNKKQKYYVTIDETDEYDNMYLSLRDSQFDF